MAEVIIVPDGNLIPGQSVTLTVKGTVIDNNVVSIENISVSKKGKMSVQDILQSQTNARLKSIDTKTSPVSPRI